jgi:cytochrome c
MVRMIDTLKALYQPLARGLAITLALASFAGSAKAEPVGAGGDPVRGGRLFLQCRACHNVDQNGPNGVGPNLWGVVGAKAGSKSGYHYSESITASGLVWTPAKLDEWLTQPTALVPGTHMAFQGVSSAESRRDIIAYLSTLTNQTSAGRAPQ